MRLYLYFSVDRDRHMKKIQTRLFNMYVNNKFDFGIYRLIYIQRSIDLLLVCINKNLNKMVIKIFKLKKRSRIFDILWIHQLIQKAKTGINRVTISDPSTFYWYRCVNVHFKNSHICNINQQEAFDAAKAIVRFVVSDVKCIITFRMKAFNLHITGNSDKHEWRWHISD